MTRTRRNASLSLFALATIVVVAWGAARAGVAVATSEVVSVEPPSVPPPPPATVARRARRTAALPAAYVVAAATEAPVAEPDPVAPSVSRVLRRASPARGSAAPRSVHILRVPVPASLPQRSSIAWEMHPGPRAEVLSAYAGRLAPGTPDSAREITVVTRVPARAAAGILPVGEAEFRSDSLSVVVPIELVIDRVRRASIVPARANFGALAGRALQLSVEVRNLGNSPDTVVIESELPPGWSSAAPQQIALMPGERRVVTVRTKVPRTSGTTAAYPSVRARLGDSVVYETTLPVQVDDPSEPDHPTGPLLTVGTSTAFGDSVTSSPAVDFAVSGAVANGVAIIGRAAYVADENTVDRRALARAGAYLGGAFVSLRGPGWFGTAGNTGATLSPLTGIGAFGHGVMGGATRGPVTVNGMVADVPGGNGMQAGARADYRVRPRVTIGFAASHFRDAGTAGRSLDAAGLVATAQPGAGFRITGEAAWRQFTGGSGAGVGLMVERNTTTEMLSVAAEHAPGGSEAYGRALSDLSAVYGRRFGKRVSFQSNYFSSVDRPPRSGGEYTANGWSIGPRYALTPDLTAELDVRRNGFESRNPASPGVASSDLTTSAGLRKVGGRVQWTAGGSVGGTERTTTLGGISSTFTASRFGVNGGASVILPRLVLGGGLDYSRTGAGSGLAPRQMRLTVGASRFTPFDSPRAPVFRAEAEITSWLGDQPSAVVARIGSQVELPADLTLIVDAERNPMIRPTGGRTPWVVAVRLERGFTLGWAMRTPSTRGAVYQDQNGNGVRDAGEDGLAGVLIRRGNQSTVTDQGGRFKLAGRDDAPIEVDPISLPSGVVAPGISASHAGAVSLAVVPTGMIAVKLRPEVDDLGRRPESPLDQLAVVARDDRGAEWYLRADSTGTVTYDALPPGRYTFVADFAGTTERLRQVGEPVILEVKPGENLPPLVVRFTVRAARLFNGGQGQTDQGRRRR